MAKRRLYIGKIDGSWDCRISRPGYDAMTDDVNDPKKISFAASRNPNALISEVGVIPDLNTWYDFQNTYSDIPRILLSIKRNGMYTYVPIHSISQYGVGSAGSLYVPVIETGRIMITTAVPDPVQPFTGKPVDDSFIYFVIS